MGWCWEKRHLSRWYGTGKRDIFHDGMVLGKGHLWYGTLLGKGTSSAMVWCWEKGHLLYGTILGKGTSLVWYDAGKGDIFSCGAAQSLWQFQHRLSANSKTNLLQKQHETVSNYIQAQGNLFNQTAICLTQQQSFYCLFKPNSFFPQY